MTPNLLTEAEAGIPSPAFNSVRERHGVSASTGGFVTLNEIAGGVRVTACDGALSRSCDISADEAAYLASELYRMALRAKEAGR